MWLLGGRCRSTANYLVLIWTVFIVISLPNILAYTQDNFNVPCKYMDSINITNGQKNRDGSITYDGNRFVKGEYGMYDYTFENGRDRVPAEPHIRGCLCIHKQCVSLCCPPRSVYIDGIGCTRREQFAMPIEVWSPTNETKMVDLFKDFGYVLNLENLPCEQTVEKTPEQYPTDAWYLYYNGSVLHYNESISPHDYCILLRGDNVTNEVNPRLITCLNKFVDSKYALLPYGMLLSVPFLIATFIVYALLPELRNIHGKCLLCYLFSLTIAYSSLSLLQLKGSEYVDPTLCRSVGFLAYFSFLCAFLWLNVISFDLWWNFRGMKGISMLSANKQFTIYFIYACGLSTLMVTFAYVMDRIAVPSSIQPGIGVGNCYLKKNKLTEFLYFYLIIAIIITLNSTFFILTALKIRRVQRDLAKIVSKEDSCKHLNNIENEKTRFGLFLRLFIIMGVTWCMEAISWAIGTENLVFHLADLMNTIQGVLIFVLFVMKPKIKQLLWKRWRVWRGIPIAKPSTSSSLVTRVSNVNMTNLTNQSALLNTCAD